MKLLALDTSTDVMSLAVQHGDQVFTHTAPGGSETSATLIPAITALMAQAGLQFSQLDAIAFGRGPGSFTGLRTACAVTQGLAFAANVRVLPIDTLQALAQQAFNQLATADGTSPPKAVCAALDARMGEVYYGYYNFDSCLSSKYVDYLPKSPLNMVLPDGLGHFVLAGNVRPTYDAQLPAALLAAPYLSCAPTASAMLQLAPQLIAAGGLVNAQDALPLYIRDKVAQTTAEREGALPSVAPATTSAMVSVAKQL
jgi:tRNA threonylcarbamoyladenosine biosynthesis protein TsaB